MITQWGKFRDFINSKEIGHVFNYHDFVLFARLKQLNESILLGYTSLLKQAKFIKRVSRGKYELVDHLPLGLTMGALFALLRGDNLTYVEQIQKHKDSIVLKKQFIHERNDVLARLIEELKPLIAYAEKIETSAFGLKQLLRNCTWERSKTPNPTRSWLKNLKGGTNE